MKDNSVLRLLAAAKIKGLDLAAKKATLSYFGESIFLGYRLCRLRSIVGE